MGSLLRYVRIGISFAIITNDRYYTSLIQTNLTVLKSNVKVYACKIICFSNLLD